MNVSKHILKNVNHFGTITIHLEGYFLFSLIKSDNDKQQILIFDTIEFNDVKRFEKYFEQYKNVTRWFSNLIDNKTLIFNQYFDEIGFKFYTHNIKTSIDEFYYNFQGYINTKEIIMNNEISKIIKTQCNIENKEIIGGDNVEFMPTPHLFNLMYSFKNIQNPIDYFEFENYRLNNI